MYAAKPDEQLMKSKLYVKQKIQEREKHLRFQAELETKAKTKFSFFKFFEYAKSNHKQQKKEHEHGSSYKKINIYKHILQEFGDRQGRQNRRHS